jgi:hypothetical protein
MSLTRDDWATLVLPVIGTAVLVLMGDFAIREWYRPDLRYSTGGAYLSSKLAVSSVGLKNWGHADAEDVTITAAFADRLIDISPGPMGTRFRVEDGGIGDTFVTGTITRLVPDETAYIYFITEPSSPRAEPPGQFIRSIKFKGGLGKTGTPWFPWRLVDLLALAVGGGMLVGLDYWLRRVRATYYDHYSETVRMGVSAAQEGVSREQLRTRIEEYRKTIPLLRRPGKEHMLRSAQAAFAGVKQSPTPTGDDVSPVAAEAHEVIEDK